MEKPRIRHIALNVQNRDELAEFYKRVFGLEEKYRGPNGTVYLSVAEHEDTGKILILKDGKPAPFVRDLDDPRGLVAWKDWLFVAEERGVLRMVEVPGARVYRVLDGGAVLALAVELGLGHRPVGGHDVQRRAHGASEVTRLADGLGRRARAVRSHHDRLQRALLASVP